MNQKLMLTNNQQPTTNNQQTLRKLLFSFMLLFMVSSYSQSEPEINTNFESNVIVYPNPSFSIFNFDLTQVEQKFKEITIYNILGEKVFSSELTPRELNSVNLSHLANGYYLARLFNDNENTTIKIIKN
jgi:Secretion system C-terminal sorting domain